MPRAKKSDVLTFMKNVARANSNCKKYNIVERRRWMYILMVLEGVIPAQLLPVPTVSLDDDKREDRLDQSRLSPLDRYVKTILKNGGDDGESDAATGSGTAADTGSSPTGDDGER